ncbi:MAG: hypothetical protein HY711_06145 [Candidatus Melainabacteria bacterium]|nr:hypothetical protein [Candidatus Melainabacteria bacterium]
MKDTWQFPNHVTDNRATVAHQLGPLAFEMTLMTVAGCAGAKAGQGLLRHGLQPLSPKALKMITPSQAYAMKRFKLDSSGELVLFPDGVARYQPLADGSVFTYAHRALNPTSSIFYKPAKSPARILPTLKVIQSEKTGLFDRWITQSGEGSLVLTERQLSQSRGAKALLKDIPNGSLPIGFGRARIAWLTPDGTVAVLGPVHARAQCPELLQPFKTQVKRDMQLEWFPYAETRNVTMAEMQALKARMENAGWTASDWKPANCGRLANGRVVRLDPENVIRGQQSPWIMDGS